jgi:hypothetical protein
MTILMKLWFLCFFVAKKDTEWRRFSYRALGSSFSWNMQVEHQLIKSRPNHADLYAGNVIFIRMYEMQSTKIEKPKIQSKKYRMIAGILESALDMEDEIAHSVYLDYMDRKNWPADLKDETFEEIRDYLTTLLDDTQRHRNIIKNLQYKLDGKDGKHQQAEAR